MYAPYCHHGHGNNSSFFTMLHNDWICIHDSDHKTHMFDEETARFPVHGPFNQTSETIITVTQHM